jgi:beta-fructofuranosidase
MKRFLLACLAVVAVSPFLHASEPIQLWNQTLVASASLAQTAERAGSAATSVGGESHPAAERVPPAYETPTMPAHPPSTWLTYHLAHPGPSGAIPADPNPAFYYKGRYHLHYIYNHKEGCAFAHVSSTDMVHWKWHPTTLTPGTTGHGMFSGTGFFTKDGRPAMIYHGQGSGRNQIAFALDDDLEKWSKPIAVEPLTAAGEKPNINHWDPDCWLMNGSYYALSGGSNPKLMKSQELSHWLYLGELFHPDFPTNLGVSKSEDTSCANLFKLGNQWMLLCISHGLGARYYLGDFVGESYLPHHHALLNWARWDCFAPESLLTKDGRRVMWAWCTPWVNDMQRTDRKKNFDRLLNNANFQQGIQSLPRELSLPKDGVLRIKPLRELEELRQGRKRQRNITVQSDTTRVLRDIQGDTLELEVVIASPKAKNFGINLLCDAQGENGFTIASGAGSTTLTVDYITPPFQLREREDLTLRIFIDKSMIEVFANNRQAAVAWHEYPPQQLNISLFAKGGDLLVKRVTAWNMQSIYGAESARH